MLTADILRTLGGGHNVALPAGSRQCRDSGGTPCAERAAVHLDRMSDLQSQMYVAVEEAQRADQKKRAAGEALLARQLKYETAKLRGRQQRINRARAALKAAQLAYDALQAEAEQLDDKAEEVVQAQVRAAYM